MLDHHAMGGRLLTEAPGSPSPSLDCHKAMYASPVPRIHVGNDKGLERLFEGKQAALSGTVNRFHISPKETILNQRTLQSMRIGALGKDKVSYRKYIK